MPGNIVIINKSEDLEWYVGDSRIESLISFLDENGIKQEQGDMKMTTPLAVKDKLIVIEIKEERKTEGGIIVPDTVQKDPQLTCKVLSTGQDVSKEIVKDDIIICHRSAGQAIIFKGKTMIVLGEGEVYAVLSTKQEA